ncbi:MAG: glutamate--tRNA ligase [Candidatus Marinimicrobia bacterium]|nr:glutamate--tRNA ligase [Candidatus Neomarinimicrobiota bacterium]
METKVRFAPSPTGFLHVGGLRTALFNYLYARKTGGKIVLRIEDTDQARKVENAVENLLSSFEKLDIHFDEGPHKNDGSVQHFQSQRLSIYKEHIQKLIDSGDAYPCFCDGSRLETLRKKLSDAKATIKYDRKCLNLSAEEIQAKQETEPFVIRMKIPNEEKVKFYDVVREKVSINCSEIDDQVLIKSDGFPTYHFANVVDDHLMGITHVMRGEEWLPSTPKHVLLYRFFGWNLPKYIHLPLLLNPDRSKLSKRQGDVAVEDYLEKGFLPETLINFVALLGWHPKDDREMFSLKELENEFSLKRIHKSGAVFDLEKLKWMNSQYLMQLPLETVVERSIPFFENANLDTSDKAKLSLIVDATRQRVQTLAEMPEASKMYFTVPVISVDNKELINAPQSRELLQKLKENIENSNIPDGDGFKQIVMNIGKEISLSGKSLFFPIRTAIYGEPKGPDLVLLFNILGKKEVINRLNQ